MMCSYPFRRGVMEFGCGQCMPCRANRRRLWTSRIMLESLMHGDSSFVTLTYAKEFYPTGGTLVPRDLTLFLKRFRERVGEFRYYAVGEYGELTFRPHYHLIMFGVSYLQKDLIALTWGKGHVHVGSLTPESAGYCASYVESDKKRVGNILLKGRHPEFCRMSRRPGIGAKAVDSVIGDAIVTEAGCKSIGETGDVPMSIRMGGSRWPLGRYLRSRLRLAAGMNPGMPESTQNRIAFERWQMLQVDKTRDQLEEKRLQVARRVAWWYKARKRRKEVL